MVRTKKKMTKFVLVDNLENFPVFLLTSSRLLTTEGIFNTPCTYIKEDGKWIQTNTLPLDDAILGRILLTILTGDAEVFETEGWLKPPAI